MSDSGKNGNRSSGIVGTVSGAALVGLALRHYGSAPLQASTAPSGPLKQVTIVEFTNAGVRTGVVSVPMIQKSNAEWRKQLPADSFEVARHADTERPFTGQLLNVHAKGVFRCICCDTALFSSDTKFESGTGWPSFWAPIAKENVLEISDTTLGMVRTAVSCRRCDLPILATSSMMAPSRPVYAIA